MLRSTAEGNMQRSNEALQFAQLFFRKQNTEKNTLSEMYHHKATLIWDGHHYELRSAIDRFYTGQKPSTTDLQALDAQIMPKLGDITDMLTIIAGGTFKQDNKTYNFSRTFLLGPNYPGSNQFLIISDTMRLHA